MKTHLIILLYTSALACSSLLQAQTTLWEKRFTDTTSSDFEYGSWINQLSHTTEGLSISGQADHSGGVGFNVTPPLNLSSSSLDSYAIVIRAKRLPESTAEKLGVMLCSTSCSDASVWQFLLSELNTDKFTDIEIPLFIAPVYTRDSGVNFSNILEVQLQGDYTNPGMIGILVESVRIVEETTK